MMFSIKGISLLLGLIQFLGPIKKDIKKHFFCHAFVVFSLGAVVAVWCALMRRGCVVWLRGVVQNGQCGAVWWCGAVGFGVV